MKEVKEILDFAENLYQGKSKPEQPSTASLSPQKQEILRRTLHKINNYGYSIGPEAAADWADALKELEENQLITGIRKLNDYTGDFLKPGQFREMCKIPTPKALHRPFKAIPRKPLEADEVHRRTAQLRSELDL